MQAYSPVVSEKRGPTSRQQMMAVVPLMMLGLLAATCLLASAEWKSGETTSLLGAGEETAAAHVSWHFGRARGAVVAMQAGAEAVVGKVSGA